MLTLENARKVLKPHNNAFVEVIDAAWSDYQGLLAPHLPGSSNRGRASNMHELMVIKAKTKFSTTLGVHVVPRCGTTYFSFDDEVIVRFKKLDANLRTRNYPTQAALKFDRQLPLPDVPAGHRVAVGYVLDPFGTAIDSMHVVYREGNRVVWSYELDRPSAGAVLPIPVQVPLITPRVSPVFGAADRENA